MRSCAAWLPRSKDSGPSSTHRPIFLRQRPGGPVSSESVRTFDEPFYVGYNVGGYELGLLRDADPTDGALVYWGVQDVETAVAAAMADGATEHSPVAEVGGGIVTATIRTPPGAILGLIHNPNFGPV
jgi:hypothetical protein